MKFKWVPGWAKTPIQITTNKRLSKNNGFISSGKCNICLSSSETPTVVLLPNHCLSEALKGWWRLCRVTRSVQAGGPSRKDVWLSISSFHSQHLLLPGGHHCIHDNGWPQRHTNINLNLVCACGVCACVRASVRACVFLPMWSANVNFANYLDHIWGLMYSNVHTFTVLILPLKVLSYPKSNHHALFITYSTKAQRCVTSKKWNKTT